MDKSRYGVHETHCCVLHGCKYGDENCPVETGEIDQEYTCEDCSDYFSQRDGGVEVSRAKIEIVRETKRAVMRGNRTVDVNLSRLQFVLENTTVGSFDPTDYYYPGDRYFESLRNLKNDIKNAMYLGTDLVELNCADVFEVIH